MRKELSLNFNMKRLLIVGTGDYGKVVKEVAKAVGNYEKCVFIQRRI